MTRNGKIARLPYELRKQVNQRLEDAVPGIEIVAWLNKQAEVRELVKEQFMSQPISEQNLSEWKQGGFLDWQKRREAMEMARDLADHADEMMEVAGGPLSDKLAALLAAKYMVMLKAVNEVTGENPDDWQRLHELCGDLVALRKGDHSAERVRIERRRC